MKLLSYLVTCELFHFLCMSSMSSLQRDEQFCVFFSKCNLTGLVTVSMVVFAYYVVYGLLPVL